MFSRNITGISGELSRLLQFLFIFLLIINTLLNKKKIKVINPLFILYRRYFLFFVFAILSAIIGIINNSYGNGLSLFYGTGLSFSSFINGPLIRPIFEYLITIYYFIYFAVLPFYFINTKTGIAYLFRVFSITYLACLYLGIIDYLFLLIMNIEFIPRHFGESPSVHVGLRFHGLAGEPRDAFVYFVFGIAMHYLKSLFFIKKINRKIILLSLIAILLTNSLSGIIGIIISLFLLATFYLSRLSAKRLAYGFVIFCSFTFIIYLSITNTIRFENFMIALSALYNVLDSGVQIPPVLIGQMPNIYPIWERWLSLNRYEILPIIFGTGFGSASAINNLYIGSAELMNPHANFVRLFYENGLVGLILFISSFIYPLKKLNLPVQISNHATIMMIFVLGAFLAHRSPTLYIYLGASLIVLSNLKNKPQNKIA